MKQKYVFYNYILVFISFLLIFSADGFCSFKKNKIKYRTFFGKCPSRTAGSLTLRLVKTFEEEMSLRSIKQEMIQGNLSEKHFISDYKINYDPLKNFLLINFECPEPLMKVQVYKNKETETYNAILVETGELFDPTYEVLLKNEHKLIYELPFLALPLNEMNKKIQYKIAMLVKKMKLGVRKALSEIIVNDSKELTIIISYKGRPTSIFMGKDNWHEKTIKLQKIITYMHKKNKIPAIINLTNAKKVVVKFSDKI